MTRLLGPTPADDLGADLEPVWDRLAEYAKDAPHAGPGLAGRVHGALLTELDRTLRPVAHRPHIVVRPLIRPSSLRSLVAAAALVALLGASVALAGAGVAQLNRAPVDQPSATAEESDEPDGDNPRPLASPTVRPAPVVNVDPEEDGGDVEEDADEQGDDEDGEDGEDGAETDEPDETDRADDDADDDETAKPDEDEADEPSDEPEDDEPEDNDPDDDSSDEPEADEPD